MYFSMTLVRCLNILNIRYLQRTKDCVEKTLNRLEGKICGRVSFVTLYFFFGLVFFFFLKNLVIACAHVTGYMHVVTNSLAPFS